MRRINILICVNVGQAIEQNNVGKFVFMVDTTGYSGDGNEGSNELNTTLGVHDLVVWTVKSIDPSETVSISSFSGSAIPAMVNPAAYPKFADTVWGARVHQQGVKVQYSMTLLLNDNVQLAFDPFLTATKTKGS